MSRIKLKILFSLSFTLVSFFSHARIGIDTAMSIRIGGLNQWISIKSADITKPVLLFLHGGPGNSVMGYAEKFTTELEKNFVVVQWDQRESGKTASLNGSTKPLTVSLMESDAIEVIEYLCHRFSQPKIYLMGHSWGGFLGLLIAARHPEMLKGYIAICPMIHQIESERLALRWMLDKATAEDNKKALAELHKIRIPFETGEQLYYHRGWLIHYSGGKFPSKEVVLTWSVKWLQLFNEASVYNFLDTTPALECPVYFFVGAKDHQTSTKLTKEYFNKLKSPEKRLFVFEDTAHNLPTHSPGRLQETILNEIVHRKGH